MPGHSAKTWLTHVHRRPDIAAGLVCAAIGKHTMCQARICKLKLIFTQRCFTIMHFEDSLGAGIICSLMNSILDISI